MAEQRRRAGRRVAAALAVAALGAVLLIAGTGIPSSTAHGPSPATALLDALPVAPEILPGARRGFTAPRADACGIAVRVLQLRGRSVRSKGCRIEAGVWTTAFTGARRTRPGQLVVLHTVTVTEALRSGAARWGTEQRAAFIADVDGAGSYAVVDAALAEARSGRQPAGWLPARGRCAYARAWVAVKTRWRLSVDPAEAAALRAVLERCPASAEQVHVVSPQRFLPLGDTRHWRQVIAQDFGVPAAAGRFGTAYPGWSQYDGGRDSSAVLGRVEARQGEYRNERTVTVEDGLLRCDLGTVGVRPILCAITPALADGQRPAQRYGRWAVRFRTDRIPGYKIAWLLWPASNDWKRGEIDFPEAELDSTIHGATHRTDGDPSENAFIVDTGASPTDWHTAAIEWRPGSIAFVLDGRRWTTTVREGQPAVPMMWALQAESRLSAVPPVASAGGRITIDWLTAYEYRP